MSLRVIVGSLYICSSDCQITLDCPGEVFSAALVTAQMYGQSAAN